MKKTEWDREGDDALCRRALRNPESAESRRAASELLARYQRRVYVWCLRLTRDHEQACDLAQDVLLTAYRKLATFEGRSGFSSWLFVVTRNRCLSALRRPSLWTEGDEALAHVPDPRPEPDRDLEERLDEEALLHLIQRELEPLEQEAVWMRCVERMPVEEITTLLRITSASGARGVLQRARRKLEAALARSQNS